MMIEVGKYNKRLVTEEDAKLYEVIMAVLNNLTLNEEGRMIKKYGKMDIGNLVTFLLNNYDIKRKVADENHCV